MDTLSRILGLFFWSTVISVFLVGVVAPFVMLFTLVVLLVRAL